MPLFITYASYSNTGIKGIIDKPIDRTEAIRTLAEKAGYARCGCLLRDAEAAYSGLYDDGAA